MSSLSRVEALSATSSASTVSAVPSTGVSTLRGSKQLDEPIALPPDVVGKIATPQLGGAGGGAQGKTATGGASAGGALRLSA